jgi:hypothetical protein
VIPYDVTAQLTRCLDPALVLPVQGIDEAEVVVEDVEC